jgi:3-oxoacyl-[acyl-carrier protein] reductase
MFMFAIDLTGKVAWVTGASRGIGRSIALNLAKAGCDIALGYRSAGEQAEQVGREIAAMGRRVLPLQVDIADQAQAEATFNKISESLGPVEILVNNAGVIADNLFMGLEDSDWQKVINTNIMGTVHACRSVIRDMMMKRWGRIINISSVAGTKGGRGQSNYAATKGAIEAVSRSLAVELSSRNITVNCVAPGVIATDMSSEVRKLGNEEIMNRLLIKRYGTPDEIAACVVFLASDLASYITGQVIHIDGGMKMP